MPRALPKVAVRSCIVTLPVSRWEPVLAWYEAVLGCEVVSVDASVGETATLRFGRQRFTLMLDWCSPEVPRDALVRQASLLLEVPSRADARRALKARGAAPTLTQTGFLRIEDPEGNVIYLQETARLRGRALGAAEGRTYLTRCEAWRARHAAQMKADGIEAFDDAAALQAFRKRHSLQPPRPPRRKR
jgi:catechol 2,3-dioxygenase-like lactoylglutathione lyase family enzyme